MAEDVSNTAYTVTWVDFQSFKKFADTEPMCDGWTHYEDIGRFITILVPNWTAPVREFYRRISENIGEYKVIDTNPSWFDGINPVVAKNFGLTPPQDEN